ncbi:MAG: hypothetical protein GQ477_03935 [Nanohaloarchaea archaeon]|nr:hypothetical protein [Candidatus Nanohaloarchaea archaeon]
MAKITYSVESVDIFLRFRIKVHGLSKNKSLKMSAILYLKSGKEYVFMPDVIYPDVNITYPERSVNYLTCVGDSEFQFFFNPGLEKPTALRVLASIDDVLVDRSFKLRC